MTDTHREAKKNSRKGIDLLRPRTRASAPSSDRRSSSFPWWLFIITTSVWSVPLRFDVDNSGAIDQKEMNNVLRVSQANEVQVILSSSIIGCESISTTHRIASSPGLVFNWSIQKFYQMIYSNLFKKRYRVIIKYCVSSL